MTDDTYEGLRRRALTRRSADLGLSRKPGRPVWGVVMETSTDDGISTLIATDDGSATLLMSTGGGVHLPKDRWPYTAAARLITAAADFMLECAPAWSYPLPDSGMIRFYLLTFDGVLTAEAPPKELASGKSPFSDLFYAAHDVLFLTQFVSRDPDWMSHRPVPGAAPGAAPPVAAKPAEVPPAEAMPAAAPPAHTPPVVSSKNDLLLRAAARNDVDEVARLLAEGHDHEPNAKGVTPLMGAAHAGALEPLRLLLAAGAPVDAQEGHGYTALMLACNAGHTVCVRLLLGAGAAVEAHDNEGLTPIMFAAQNGHDDIVRVLMERGADPNASNIRGTSAVSLAKQKGHEQTVSILAAGYELPRLGQ